MALKLSGYFGVTPYFWLNLQNTYNLFLVKSPLLINIRLTVFMILFVD